MHEELSKKSSQQIPSVLDPGHLQELEGLTLKAGWPHCAGAGVLLLYDSSHSLHAGDTGQLVAHQAI